LETRSAVLVSLFAAACGAGPIAASAQGFPSKQIRIIAPFPAGGSTDVTARLIGQKLTDVWGQQVILENRPGAGGTIGADYVAKALPDGHVLLMTTISLAINASLHKKLPFDTLKDLAPITQISALPLLLVVHPSVPVKNVKELVVLARARPGQLTYASSGAGTSPHLAAEMFKTMAGVDMIHVPYKGNAPAMTDLLGGHVSVNFGLLPPLLPQVKAGKLRALAATTARRVAVLPDLPTIAESGYPDYEINSWQGMLAPGATPKEIISRLNVEIVRIIGLPEVRDRLAAEGAEPVGSSAEQFAAHLRAEVAKWARVVKESGARAD